MRQLILAVTLTAIGVAFGIANSHHVEVGYVVGEPIEIRLVFLLAITYGAGAVTAVFWQLYGRIAQRRRALPEGKWRGPKQIRSTSRTPSRKELGSPKTRTAELSAGPSPR